MSLNTLLSSVLLRLRPCPPPKPSMPLPPPTDHLSRLPPELLLGIAEYLTTPDDLLALAGTCSRLAGVCRDTRAVVAPPLPPPKDHLSHLPSELLFAIAGSLTTLDDLLALAGTYSRLAAVCADTPPQRVLALARAASSETLCRVVAGIVGEEEAWGMCREELEVAVGACEGGKVLLW